MTTQEKENYLKQFSKGTFYTIAVTEWFSSCGTTYRFVGTNGKLTPLKPNLAFLGCAMEFKTKADAEKKAKEAAKRLEKKMQKKAEDKTEDKAE